MILTLLYRSGIRLRIWAKAASLKENRSRPSPVSKMSDNEDPAPSLGNSEMLSVQHSVGEPVPEFPQRPEDGAKGSPAVVRQDTGDVFPENPLGFLDASNSEKVEGQDATRIIQPKPLSSLGEGLAWGSADEQVDWGLLEAFIVI